MPPPPEALTKTLFNWIFKKYKFPSSKFGFTLSEILITVAIVGVVAVLTLPSFIEEYQERSYLTQLKKVTAELNSVFNLVIAEHGLPKTWVDPTVGKVKSETLNEIFSQHLNYYKVCDHYKYDNKCHSGDIYNMSGTKFWTTNPFNYYEVHSTTEKKYFLKSGAIITIDRGARCTGEITYSECQCGYILVDTNGLKKPNRNGVDVFAFHIGTNKLIPKGRSDAHSLESFKSNSFGAFTAWALYNNNMDYLHCYDKLDWNKKHSCKE